MKSEEVSAELSAQQKRNRFKSRKFLILVVVVFALPVILAKLSLELNWLDLGVTNNGTLLAEELTLKKLGIEDSQFKQQWLMLYSLPKECENHCEKVMEVVHNTYVALGKDMPRVTPIALFQHQFTAAQQQQLEKSQWQLQAMSEPAKSYITAPQVFIVDPLGNVFLSHSIPENNELLPTFGKQVLADMKKLLKYSKVG